MDSEAAIVSQRLPHTLEAGSSVTSEIQIQQKPKKRFPVKHNNSIPTQAAIRRLWTRLFS